MAGLGSLFYEAGIKLTGEDKLTKLESTLSKISETHTVKIVLDIAGDMKKQIEDLQKQETIKIKADFDYGGFSPFIGDIKKQTASVIDNVGNLKKVMDEVSKGHLNGINIDKGVNVEMTRLAKNLKDIASGKFSGTELEGKLNETINDYQSVVRRLVRVREEMQNLTNDVFGGKQQGFIKNASEFVTSALNTTIANIGNALQSVRADLMSRITGGANRATKEEALRLKSSNLNILNDALDINSGKAPGIDSFISKLENIRMQTDYVNASIGRMQNLIGSSNSTFAQIDIQRAYINEILPGKGAVKRFAKKISDILQNEEKFEVNWSLSMTSNAKELFSKAVRSAVKSGLKSAIEDFNEMLSKATNGVKITKDSGDAEKPSKTKDEKNAQDSLNQSKKEGLEIDEKTLAIQTKLAELINSKITKKQLNANNDNYAFMNTMLRSKDWLPGGAMESFRAEAMSTGVVFGQKDYKGLVDHIKDLQDAKNVFEEAITKINDKKVSDKYAGAIQKAEEYSSFLSKVNTDILQGGEISNSLSKEIQTATEWAIRLNVIAESVKSTLGGVQMPVNQNATINAQEPTQAATNITITEGPIDRTAEKLERTKELAKETKKEIDKIENDKNSISFDKAQRDKFISIANESGRTIGTQKSGALSILSDLEEGNRKIDEFKAKLDTLQEKGLISADQKSVLSDLVNNSLNSVITDIEKAKTVLAKYMRDVSAMTGKGSLSDKEFRTKEFFTHAKYVSNFGAFYNMGKIDPILAEIDKLINQLTNLENEEKKVSDASNMVKTALDGAIAKAQAWQNSIGESATKQGSAKGNLSRALNAGAKQAGDIFANLDNVIKSGNFPDSNAAMQVVADKASAIKNEIVELSSLMKKVDASDAGEFKALTSAIEQQREKLAQLITEYNTLIGQVAELPKFAKGGKIADPLSGLEQKLNSLSSQAEKLKALGIDIDSIFKRMSGKLVGPGTGTSDNILAMVSNGEFISTAKSTAQFEKWLNLFNAIGGGTHDIEQVKSALQSLNRVFGGNDVIDRALGQIDKNGKIHHETIKKLSEELAKMENTTVAVTASQNATALNNEAAAANNAAAAHNNLNNARGGGKKKGVDVESPTYISKLINRAITDAGKDISLAKKAGYGVGSITEAEVMLSELRRSIRAAGSDEQELKRIFDNNADIFKGAKTGTDYYNALTEAIRDTIIAQKKLVDAERVMASAKKSDPRQKMYQEVFGVNFSNKMANDPAYARERAANIETDAKKYQWYIDVLDKVNDKYHSLLATMQRTKEAGGDTTMMDQNLAKWARYIEFLDKFKGDMLMMSIIEKQYKDTMSRLGEGFSTASKLDSRSTIQRKNRTKDYEQEAADEKKATEKSNKLFDERVAKRVKALEEYDRMVMKVNGELGRLNAAKITYTTPQTQTQGLTTIDVDTSRAAAKIEHLRHMLLGLQDDLRYGIITKKEFTEKASELFASNTFMNGRDEAQRYYRLAEREAKESARRIEAERRAGSAAGGRNEITQEREAQANNNLAAAIEKVEAAYLKATIAAREKATAGEKTDNAVAKLQEELQALKALQSMQLSGEDLIEKTKAAISKANATVSTANSLQSQQRSINALANEWEVNKAAASGYNSQLAQTLKQTFSLDQQFSQLAMTLQNTFSVIGVQQFAQEIIKIGGELEKQQLALAQILGGTDKANAIYGQVADLSMVSPFTVEDLLKNVKQLSAFGIKYDELYDTARRLSDIAAAVGVDFGRISYEYSQLSSMGYLDRRHLRMFSMSGVPLVDKLQEYYSAERGEAVGREEIDKMIFKREVSADVVKKVLWDMTDEGGKFFNMQQIMAESLASKYANLTNAWNLMLGEMAQGAPGDVLKDIATYLTELTNHWQAIAKVGLGSFAIVALNKIAPIAALAGRAMGDLSSKFALSAKEESRLNAQILRTKGTFRELSIAEQQEIAMSGKITTAQLKNAAAEGKLTKEMAAQLYLRKEITGEQLTAISTSVGMTGNDLVGLGAAPGANWKTFKSTIKADFSKAWDRIKTSAAGAGTAIKNFGKSLINTQAISQKFGSASLRSWAMMKLGLSSLASGVRKLGASIISLAINPATIIFAVIGAITSLVSSIRESAERVAEITDALKNKAKDNIEEFNKMIESVGGKIAISAEVVPTLSEEKQRAVIEKLSEYLKDKLPASGAILNDVFKTDDEGNYIKDRVTQIEILRDAIEKAEKANEIFNNIAGIGASAIQKTEWTWYDWHEDIVENAKDYGNAVIKFNQGIAGLTSKRTEIEDALHKAIANDSSISQLLFPNIEDESERAAKAAEMEMESILGRLKQSMTGSKIKNLLKSSGASEEVAKYVGEVFEKFDEPKADLQYNINKFIGYYKDAIKGRKELFDEKGNLKEEAKYAIRIDMEAALSNGSITQEQFDFIMQSAEKEGLIPIKVDFELQKSNNRNDFQRMLIESIGSYPIESGFAIQTSIEQMVDKSKDVASLFENVGKAQKEAKEKIERLSEAYERLRINAANANVPLEEYAKSVSQSNTVTEYEKAINLQSKYNELLVAARNGYSAVQIAASSAVDEIEGLGITEKSEIEGAISSSSTLSGVIENLEKKQSDYKKQLDLVADAYSKIQNKAREGNMSVEEFVNQLGNEKAKETVTLWESIAAAVNATVNALNSIKGPQTKMQSALTNVLDSKRNNVLNSDYQTEFDNINIAINKSSNIGDIANNVQTIHNKYKGILDDYKKGKNDLNSEQLAMYEYLDGILKEIAKTGGFTLEKSSGTGDKTPNPLDDVNKRLQVLRDVRQALERETELLMKGYGDIAGLPLEAAREAAFQKIKSSGMLDDYEGQIEKFVDLEGYAEQIQKLYDEVSKIVVGKDKEDDKKKLLESIMKLLNLDIPYDIANKEAGKITERINKQMEDAGKKWDFFGTLIESGMDASEASAVAGVEKRFISFADELRDKLKTALFRIGVYNIDINDILTMDDKSIENEYGVEVQTIASKLRTELESEAQKVRSTIAEAIKASTGVEGEKESNNWLRDIVLAAIEKLNGSDEVKNKMKEAVNKMFDLKDTDLSLSHLFEDTSYKLTAAIREQYKNNKNWLKKIEKGQFKYKSDGTLDYILVDGKKVSLEKYKEIKSQVESLGNETDKATESFRKFWYYVSGKTVNQQKLKFADVAEGLASSVESIGKSISAFENIGGKFGNIGNFKLSEFISGLSEVIKGIGQLSEKDYLQGITTTVEGLSTAIGAFTEAIAANIDKHRELAEIRLKNSIDTLNDSIEYLSETIKKSYDVSSISDAYEKQVDAENKRRELLLKAVNDKAGDSGHFYRSIKYELDLSGDEIDEINKFLSKNGLDEFIESQGDLWNLSPEAFKIIKTELPDIYSKIVNATNTKNNEENAKDEIEEYIQSAGTLEKLLEEFQLKILGINIDDVRSNFHDAMMDMTSDVEDFADDFTESMMSAFVDTYVLGNEFQEWLEKWYGDLSSVMSNKELDEDEKAAEIARLKKEYSDKEQELLNKRNYIAEILGYTGETGSGLSKSISGITDEQADILAAYINGIRADTSQEVSILEQIREHVVNLDGFLTGNYGTGYYGAAARGGFEEEEEISSSAAVEAMMTQLAYYELPTLNVTAEAQLAQLNMIAEHTLAIRDNTAMMAEYMETMSTDIHRAAIGVQPIYVQ